MSLTATEYYSREPTGSQAYGAPRPNGRTHTGDDYSHSIRPDTVRVPYARAGRVTDIQRDRADLANGYGNQVTVDHGDGTSATYSHLGRITAYVGQQVTAADSPGTEGSTGWTSGSCMHLEYWQNGRRTDPRPLASAAIPAGSGGATFTPPDADDDLQEDDSMRIFKETNGSFFLAKPGGIVGIRGPADLQLLRRLLKSKPGEEDMFNARERDIIASYMRE